MIHNFQYLLSTLQRGALERRVTLPSNNRGNHNGISLVTERTQVVIRQFSMWLTSWQKKSELTGKQTNKTQSDCWSHSDSLRDYNSMGTNEE